MAKAPDILRRVNRLIVIREYTSLWQQFFSFFADDISERQFTEEEEQSFTEIVTMLSINQFKFQELSRGYFKDADDILEVLEDAVSLQHIQLMNQASFEKMQIKWHTLFIAMNKAIGKLYKEMNPKELEEFQALTAEEVEESVETPT